MSRRRKILLALLALLVVSPSVCVYWIATTENGLRFLLNRLDKVGPVTLTTRGVTGTLSRGVEVEYLRVQHRLADVTVEDAAGHVELLPLLLRRLVHAPGATARRVTVRQLVDPLKRTGGKPRFLPPTLRVEVDTARAETFELTLRNGRELLFTSVAGSATVLTDQIRVRNATLDWEAWRMSANGRMRAERPYGLDGSFQAVWRQANQPRWQAAGTFDGNLDRLPYEFDVTEPFAAKVKGSGVLRSGWRFTGDAAFSDLDLEEFGAGGALGILNGTLAIDVRDEGITAKGKVTPPGLEAGAFDVDFRGDYVDKQLRITETVIVHPPSRTRATVRGTVDVTDSGPRLQLAGGWSTFRWPLSATEPAFTSPQGRFTLAGTKPWAASAAGDVLVEDLPLVPFEVRGMLDGESYRIDEGSMEVFGGKAGFTGITRWKPAESWQVSGRMAGLDPQQLRSDLPGRLAFDFNASGAPFGEEGAIEFSVANLTGEVRDQRARGEGVFVRAGGAKDWAFRDVAFTLGSTRVRLDGHAGATPDLAFTVEASDLSLFDREARGRISATGRIAGTADAPLLKLQARGSGFEWKDYRLATLDADVDIDLTREPGRAQGTLALLGLQFGARTIDRATVALTGGANQQLVLAIDAKPLRTQLTAQGALRNRIWQGEVTRVSVEQQNGITLRNEAPAALAFNLQQLELGQLCLKGAQEQLCASGHRDGGAWDVAVSADTVPLSTFTAGLGQNFTYEGTIDLQGKLAGLPGTLPTGTVRGNLRDARLRHRLGGGREETMSLGTGTVSADATTDSFTVRVELDAGEAGSINGRLDGQRTAGNWRDFPVQGSLDARTDGLSLLDIYIGDIDKASGRLATNVAIGGTLGTPTLRGELQLREASIDIYAINLALRDLSLDARFDTNALDIRGESTIGTGCAETAGNAGRCIGRFDGRLTWRDGEPYGNLHLEGDQLLLVDVPEARIRASPDLDFRIEARRIDVTGELLLPYGRIEPADLTTAVRSSNDEVLVGAPVVDPSKRWSVYSDVLLQLGDDVRIEHLGLSARLGGALKVRTTPQLERGQGELTISDGKYEALGRLLDVDRGRLIYDNVPLGDPGIDLRAQKVFPDVTAGVNVRGTLRAPRLTFYSEPSYPQSQIASLILAGGSIATLRDSQAPGAARNDLLAQGGAILLQRAGGTVGLDDVGIESDLENQSALVVGKYLSPRLYISYGISLAEAINTLKLRWTITDRWTIRTEAGQERSADIVFTLKR